MPILAAYAVPHPPLIIPAVGHGRERGIQATVDAFEEVARRIAALEPETIVISSPHATLYRDYFHISPGGSARGSFAGFGAVDARYEVVYDEELVAEIEAVCIEEGIDAGTGYEREPALDHATMIPIHFIERELSRFRVVRIGLSGMNAGEHYRMGRAILLAAQRLGRRVAYVASGDLSHKLAPDGPYGFAPEGPEFDRRVARDFAEGDLLDLLAMDASLAERAAECGLRSFQMMAGALDGTAISSELLSYEGPFGVGYGVAAFEPCGEEGADESRELFGKWEAWRADDLRSRKDAEDAFVRIARAALEAKVMEGRRICLADLEDGLPGELVAEPGACFVSLKVDGQLRGCIGTLAPTRACLAEEIIGNAISAGTADARFAPVAPDELDELVYDVDVLGTPEPVGSIEELDPARYGVIVSCADGRRGVLLPDLDGVDSIEEQLSIAAGKGGIRLDVDDVMIERFEVVRHL